MRLLDDVIDELASRQAGSLGRDQLRAAGATSAGLRHRRRGGRLLAGPYPGTYRHPAYRVTWRGKLWALQLWGGNVGYLSHEAAGALYELDACAEGKLAITVPRGTRRRHPSVPMHETTFAIEFPRIRQGLRVTSPEQTVVDLASVLSPADADDALQSALRRRLTTTDRVSALLDGRPGTAVARELVAAAIGRRPRDSRFEGRFIRRARAAGLRLEPQFEVWVDGEQYFLDYADPSRMIAIELDGFETHATRAGFQRDATRNTLLQLAGWRVLHFTWADIRDRPDWVIACIRRALAA